MPADLFAFPFSRPYLVARPLGGELARSNWAKLNKMLSVSRPNEWLVLNCCVTDTKLTPCLSKAPISRAKSSSDRDRRSTLWTITQSTFPASTSAISRFRAGR